LLVSWGIIGKVAGSSDDLLAERRKDSELEGAKYRRLFPGLATCNTICFGYIL
jgi:hypothetical protein